MTVSILERRGQKGNRTVPRSGVKSFGSAKVEAFGLIGVGNVNRFAGQSHIGRHVIMIRLPGTSIIQGNGWKINPKATGSAHLEVKGIVDQDDEIEFILLRP